MAQVTGRITSGIERGWNAAITLVSRLGAALMSSRALVVFALLGCTILAIGPWLRPAISRDFRAIHIPWTHNPDGDFLPEFVAEVPREWRWDSVATPLLVVIVVGIVVSFWRPHWSNRVFGVLLAVSIPAVAAAYWNYPELIEFMEGEIQERGMLRVVYKQRTVDAMTNLAPDRLRILGEKYSRETIKAPEHPLAAPFRFGVWGPWLVMATAGGVLATTAGTWPQRVGQCCSWSGIGIALGLAITAPRWIAEYRWAQAERAENAAEYLLAQAELRKAIDVMPNLVHTSRYWLATGRLAYRQNESNAYSAYFLANQYLETGDLSRARAEIEYSMRESGGVTAQRVLLARIIGQIATQYGLAAKYGAAEVAWGEATAIVPWKPAYWIGETVTILAGDPQRAADMQEVILTRLQHVGDCFVSSDLASMLGDAYFAQGEFHKARDMYSAAMDLFHLPKYVNLHAQEGRLGM